MSSIAIPASHGQLEAVLWEVERPRGAALVCHPHPLFGGDLHNTLTWRLADAFRKAGLSTLRFNFRGVGGSTGQYDEGRGETDDAAAALDWLAARLPGLPLYLAGYSFGSYVALALATRREDVRGVVAVGPPLGLLPFDFVPTLPLPMAFVHGDRDDFTPLAEVEALVRQCNPPPQLFAVEDCDHFATGRLPAFSARATLAIAHLLDSR